MKAAIKKSSVLIEALPYIKKFFNKTILIKYGGSSIDDKGVEKPILEDIIFMSYAGMRPVLVHGGGPLITKLMRKAGKESRFIHGFRVTDRETVHIVDRALKKINAKVVKAMSGAGAKAFGLSGKDNGLIKVRRIKEPPGLGFVGEVTSIDTTVVKHLLDSGYIPVIYPLGVGRDGNLYNVNADDAASELAVALRAEKFVLLTNVRGVLREKDDPASLYHTLTAADIKRLIKKKVIDKGMIPKVKACVNAIKGGVKKAHMLDAGIPHALLLEIFTDEGIGTEIVR